MALGMAAFLFIAVSTVSLIIVTNKKIAKRWRTLVGILGGLIALFCAVYILLTLMLFAAID
jgi:ABC-type nickel/cobalt efflux system permease component RcnA